MPRISTDNYDTVASWNGAQDLFVVEQPDGTKVATPAMVKQFIEAGDFEATGEVKDGHGNILKDMAKSAIIGDLSQTGLTGDSVAEQLTDAVSSSKSSTNNITITKMGKVRILTFNRAVYSDIKTFFANLESSDKPSGLQFSTVMRTSPDDKYMTLAFVYASASGGLFIRHFAQYNANTIEGQIGETDKAIGELVYIVD